MLHLNALNGCDHKLRGFFPQAQYPSILSRARGQGTFCAIDACDDATRDRIMLKARDKGIKHINIWCFSFLWWLLWFSFALMEIMEDKFMIFAKLDNNEDNPLA